MSTTAAADPPVAAAERSPAADTPRLYLPELDGLRFFAFLLVFLFHLGARNERLSALVGSTAARWLSENGWVGVQIFFILSGYLIATLLLREEATLGRIDLRAFWVRRILRIWPLFYLTIFLTFFLLPILDGDLTFSAGWETITTHLGWFLAFLGNWSMAFFGPVPRDSQSVLWSVCVEEQFYLVVPLLIAWLPKWARVPAVLGLMGGSIGTRAWLAHRDANQLMLQYNTFAHFDTLLSGVLLALILGPDPRRHEGWGRRLRWLQWPIYGFGIWVISRPHLGHVEAWKRCWDFVAIWVVGVGIVAAAVTVPGGLRAGLSHPRLVWLGRISYGLYMYHEIALWVRDRCARVVGWFPFDQTVWPLLALALTIAMASYSYEHFERRFLQWKHGWTRVPSRPI